jgi:hypothetical protein
MKDATCGSEDDARVEGMHFIHSDFDDPLTRTPSGHRRIWEK